MNTEQMRKDFEAYMRKLNPCTSFARHPDHGEYRGVSVFRAWCLWQAALATQPQAPQGAVTGWQPIETAPKDGKNILLFTADGQIEGYWDGLCWEQTPCYATYDGAGGVALTCRPTHWMPLPAAPKTEEGER